ncbi:hypothetical protein GGR56DRAFT_19360 [Xylariaceae sp. FL0804]|nr:hypothetical protein GGR56DRAFT_19360 [Xylariaceae sp. FL0804]
MAPNCTARAAGSATPSDAGVAGVGVLLSFMITAGIALCISASLVFQEARRARRQRQQQGGSSSGGSNNNNESVLRRKLLNSYSDQQILTGIGLQGVGLAKVESIVPYHFFVVWMLSLLSMAVHNATLLVLVRDFRRDWVLRWFRQALMFVNLVLSCAYGILILDAVKDDINNSALPVACVWEGRITSKSAGNAPLSYVGTIVVIAGNVVVFALATWYLHSRAVRFFRAVQVAGLLLMTAISIGAVVRVSLLASAFGGDPGVALSDGGEAEWSFGQLLSVGMLLLPLVSVVEILRGEIHCAPPVAGPPDGGGGGDDDKTGLLGGNELQTNPGNNSNSYRSSFQPAPFFSRSQKSGFRT